MCDAGSDMSIQEPSSPAHRTGQPDESREPATRPIPAWITLLPILSIVATLGFWWQIRSELSAIRADQQEFHGFIESVSPTLDVSGDPAIGAEEALVTLIEFSDYECPFCIRHFSQTMPEINEKLIETGRIQYVFRDFPIAQLHPEAVLAHQATRCAAEQGRFWELHVKMFSPAGTHTMDQIEAHARDAGIDIEPFRTCVTSGRTLPDVQQSVQTAARLGANGTPAFFLGIRDPETHRVRIVQPISGAVPYEEFERVVAGIEAQLGG